MQASIAFYGGAFNPPTMAHYFAIQYLAQREDLEHALVSPCFRHAYGKEMTPYDNRIAWMERVVGLCDKREVSVFDGEEQMFRDGVQTSLTYEMLKFLPASVGHMIDNVYSYGYLSDVAALLQGPDINIVPVIGADNARDLMNGKWSRGEELTEKYQFIVLGRGGLRSREFEHLPWYFGGTDLPDVSSSMIREGLGQGNFSVLNLVPDCLHEEVVRKWGSK